MQSRRLVRRGFAEQTASMIVEELVRAGLTPASLMIDESADLRRLIRSPLFSRDQQSGAMGAVLSGAGYDIDEILDIREEGTDAFLKIHQKDMKVIGAVIIESVVKIEEELMI